MDIYEQAKIMNADYYDFRTGNIYKIQEYNKMKLIDPDARIRVTDSEGNTLGYAIKKEEST